MIVFYSDSRSCGVCGFFGRSVASWVLSFGRPLLSLACPLAVLCFPPALAYPFCLVVSGLSVVYPLLVLYLSLACRLCRVVIGLSIDFSVRLLAPSGLSAVPLPLLGWLLAFHMELLLEQGMIHDGVWFVSIFCAVYVFVISLLRGHKLFITQRVALNAKVNPYTSVHPNIKPQLYSVVVVR